MHQLRNARVSDQRTIDGSGRVETRARAEPVAGYQRMRDLPRLIRVWPAELETQVIEARARLVARLRRALREERCRGLSGHWTYDLARHAALLEAYRVETLDLARLLSARTVDRAGAPEAIGTVAALTAHDRPTKNAPPAREARR